VLGLLKEHKHADVRAIFAHLLAALERGPAVAGEITVAVEPLPMAALSASAQVDVGAGSQAARKKQDKSALFAAPSFGFGGAAAQEEDEGTFGARKCRLLCELLSQ